MESLDAGYDDARFVNVVDEDLHCAICLNVLKEPLQCQTNEHHFCASCIKRHLESFRTCPSCMEQLTLDTLKKPSRFLTKSLSELVIRCEYVNRGCPEVMSLFGLKSHSASCEYSPVKCSNEGCNKVINKREKIHHESQACKFRTIKCEDCRQMRKRIDEVELRFEALSERMSQMVTQINHLTQTVQILCPQIEGKEDIIIAGGRDGGQRLNSVEKFSWSNRSWQQLQPMRKIRSGASSVVYENKMLVTGGVCIGKETANSMEALTFDNAGEAGKWCEFLPNLPSKTSAHQTVIYKDRLFVIGGCDHTDEMIFDSIYEVFLTPPYLYNLVGRMPQMVYAHGAERFDHHIFILGGICTRSNKTTDAVIKYDIKSQECTNMPSLPYAVGGLATVKWKHYVLVIGGKSVNDAALDTVIMYDTKTGENKMLPNMNYKRNGCSAVITEDRTIVVMGGWNENNAVLSSVEFFTFGRYCWEELPSMIESRTFATVVVKCSNFA